MRSVDNIPWWSRPLLLAAGLKVGFAILAYFDRLDWRAWELKLPLPYEVNLIQCLVFGSASLLLVLGSRNDVRAAHLGGFFLIIGALFGQRLLHTIGPDDLLWSMPFRVLSTLQVEGFLPLYLWVFVERFPDASISFRARRWLRLGVRVSAAVGTIYTLISLLSVYEIVVGAPVLPEWMPRVSTDNTLWLFSAVLIVAAGIFLAWKQRRASGDEKRRGQVFVFALLVATGPVTIDSLAQILIAPYNTLLEQNIGFHTLRVVVDNLLILTMPLAAAYAVLVHRALDVKLIARKALQHALARSTAIAVVAAPFLLLCGFLYHHRGRTLAELFSGRETVLLLGALLLGVVALSYRRRILDAVDRHFFREQHNARLVLSRLVEQIPGTRNLLELSNLVRRGVDLALHLERVALLVVDPSLGQLVDPKKEVRPLDLGSKLTTAVHGHREPLQADLGTAGSPLQGLAEDERHWLVDGRVRMLAPAFAIDGSLIGLLVIGAKRSELPFLGEDRQLLTEVCASTGLVIELLRLKEPEAAEIDPAPGAGNAMECLGCSRVYPGRSVRCPSCGLDLEEALVPFVLRRMFRFEERIGTGGMAVVYRGTDLKLGRTVAIKTLPRISPEAAMHLHREARTAATVSHPGLAAVYGIETWEGIPMLILELLEGGTLADRLAEGPLDPLAVVDTGAAVALGLERIHAVGILHRDVKPSNIGYTEDGTAKLLDFGIARIQHDLRQDRAGSRSEDELIAAEDSRADRERVDRERADRAAVGQIAGTLSYLSPEALAGAEPNPSFDLWSLSVVLYEALTGENLFYGRGFKKVMEAIRQAQVPDLRQRLADCPPALAELFTEELSKNKARRSQSGRELHEKLQRVRREIVR